MAIAALCRYRERERGKYRDRERQHGHSYVCFHFNLIRQRPQRCVPCWRSVPCAGTWNLYFISQDNYRICHGSTRISCSTKGQSSASKRRRWKIGRKTQKAKSENQKLVGSNCNWAHIMHSLWTQRNMCIPNGSRVGGRSGVHRGNVRGRCYANDWCHHPEVLKVLWLHEYSVDLWN